jgi:hypothetical protein
MTHSALHFYTLIDDASGRSVCFDPAGLPGLKSEEANSCVAILTTCHYRVRATIIASPNIQACAASVDGSLVANRSYVAAHETFELHHLSDEVFCIKAFQGTYLSTQSDGLLRANTSDVSLASRYRYGTPPLPDAVTRICAIDKLNEMIRYNPDYSDREIDRFVAAVAKLRMSGAPGVIVIGPGSDVRPDALHIEFEISPELVRNGWLLQNYDRFFVFSADHDWRIEDNSIDFICHEDVFEHISQKGQIKLLAAALRALKPGGIHRINTPCLRESMRRHSDFSIGAAGVYVDEWDRWQHIAVVTENILKEYAAIVGYSRCFATVHNVSLSPSFKRDTRPGTDRDKYFGNVIMELLK